MIREETQEAATHSTWFGRRLREIRKQKNWTLRQLADEVARVSDADLSKHYFTRLSRLEKGEREVELNELVILAVALGVPPTALVLPRRRSESVQVTPSLTVSAIRARFWWEGHSLLTEQEEHDPDAGVFFLWSSEAEDQ